MVVVLDLLVVMLSAVVLVFKEQMPFLVLYSASVGVGTEKTTELDRTHGVRLLFCGPRV